MNQTIRHLFVTASAFASLLSAQAPIGNISGVVRDPSGAVVASATVKAISTTTSAARTAATNADGYFLLSTLQPGEYRIQATARASRKPLSTGSPSRSARPLASRSRSH